MLKRKTWLLRHWNQYKITYAVLRMQIRPGFVPGCVRVARLLMLSTDREVKLVVFHVHQS